MHHFASQSLTYVREGMRGSGGRETRDQGSIWNQKLSFGFTLVTGVWFLVSVRGLVSSLSNGNTTHDRPEFLARQEFFFRNEGISGEWAQRTQHFPLRNHTEAQYIIEIKINHLLWKAGGQSKLSCLICLWEHPKWERVLIAGVWALPFSPAAGGKVQRKESWLVVNTMQHFICI